MQLLLRDDMTYSVAAFAAIGTDCAENTIPLFTGCCLVTADSYDSTSLAHNIMTQRSLGIDHLVIE
jgi:hypothetical protein